MTVGKIIKWEEIVWWDSLTTKEQSELTTTYYNRTYAANLSMSGIKEIYSNEMMKKKLKIL